jgi:hypothetical protein
MTDKTTAAISEFVNDQGMPDPRLPDDRMPEAEVALRLAEFILSLPGSGAMASVAIDGAGLDHLVQGAAHQPATGQVVIDRRYAEGQRLAGARAALKTVDLPAQICQSRRSDWRRGGGLEQVMRHRVSVRQSGQTRT